MAAVFDHLTGAVGVPPIQVPTTLLVPNSNLPAVFKSLVIGVSGTEDLAPNFTWNALLSDVIGRHSGGFYGAILTGLEVTDGGGTSAAISAGYIALDGPRYVPANSVSLANNQYNWIWVSRSGIVTATVASTATPVPPPPSSTEPWGFLARVHVASAVIDEIDYSGRVFMGQGNMPIRVTNDPGAPGDTPPATVHFWTRTLGGLYLWDGASYHALGGSAGRLNLAMSNADQTLNFAQWQNNIIEATGPMTAIRNIILPQAIDGREWTVVNSTTGGFGVVFKVAGQTGVTIVAAKTARVYSNATDIKRAGPDI